MANLPFGAENLAVRLPAAHTPVGHIGSHSDGVRTHLVVTPYLHDNKLVIRQSGIREGFRDRGSVPTLGYFPHSGV